jgi:hypothetical protein
MHLSLTRLSDRRYETVITRGDGVRFHVKGVGHMFAIPHDLAHLAVEQALGLHRGFWGCVASGAVFESMTHLGGRRWPHAAERSRQVLRGNHDHVIEAEFLVRVINDALEQGHGAGSAELRQRLGADRWTPPGQPPRPISDAEIAAACAAWNEMLEMWNALPVGGTLDFDWADEPVRPARPPRGHNPPQSRWSGGAKTQPRRDTV